MEQTLNRTIAPEGLVVGSPASAPVEPPQPLEPVTFRPKSLADIERGVEQIKVCAAFMRDEFTQLAGKHVPADKDRLTRWAAWRVIEAGGDPVGYVRYVHDRFMAKLKRRPLWQQVFGEKAVESWLPEYTKEQRQAADRVSYEATEERREQYADRMKQDQLP